MTKRSGIVTVLGAGASADAEYPLAANLIEPFLKALKEANQRDFEMRKKAVEYILQHGGSVDNIPKGGQTILDWFQEMWEKFKNISSKIKPLTVPKLGPNGQPDMASQVIFDTPSGFPALTPYSAYVEELTSYQPYLETFFAFYDDYMRPNIFAIENDLKELKTFQYRFRTLRQIAFETVLGELSAFQRSPADYLNPLFTLKGPEKYGCAIATLNHDVTIEQIADKSKMELYDGFESKPTMVTPLPFGWNEPEYKELKKRWEATATNCHEFIGLKEVPKYANLLLKLHGSLGWYVMEEGTGDIGYRDELRYNSAYKYFRLPYKYVWNLKKMDIVKQLIQADAAIKMENNMLTPKAGAVFIRPYLIFARSVKTHPDRLYLDIMITFNRLLDNADMILVIGYSWGDSHINDLILDAVARGAKLVNISKSAIQKSALALWIHRFPTTFCLLKKRLFMFGGGAKRILEEDNVNLPSGETINLDLIESIKEGLPNELSLEKTLFEA